MADKISDPDVVWRSVISLALLRVQNAEAERRLYDWLVADLKPAGELAC
jgi:hypothetical protein